jgi:hypothetical protein
MVVQNGLEWLVRLRGGCFGRRGGGDSSQLGRRWGLNLWSHARILGKEIISRWGRYRTLQTLDGRI